VGTRVLIVDDHPLFSDMLAGLVARLLPEAQVERTGSIAAALACTARADYVLLDLHLPDCDDLSGLARIRAAWPRAKVAILTGDDRPELIDEARSAGAAAMIDKGLSPAAFDMRLALLFGRAV
jgi:DNA-binding NarL/FixJ family response regulator